MELAFLFNELSHARRGFFARGWRLTMIGRWALIGTLALGIALGWGLSKLKGSSSGLPRTADGRPNLNGVWQALNTANFDLEPHTARAAMALRPGPLTPVPDPKKALPLGALLSPANLIMKPVGVVPAKEVLKLGAVGAVPAGLGVVEGGKIPYKPEALEIKLKNQAQWLERDPEIKCYLPGVPRANYMPFPFQIFQSESAMLFAYEYDGAVRNILFNDPGPPPVDTWMGQSVARWEGDTLVVDVTGQNDQTWFDRSGNFHTENLHVVERYRLVDPDTILYEAEIEDPAIYTRPWKISMNLYRRKGADATLLQFKCVEFVEELMYGHLRKVPLK